MRTREQSFAVLDLLRIRFHTNSFLEGYRQLVIAVMVASPFSSDEDLDLATRTLEDTWFQFTFEKVDINELLES